MVEHESNYRILVTEDDPSLLKMLSMNLKAEGYFVVEAADGVAALEIIEVSKN